MKNSNINICYATDANYIPHMCASMASILSNAATGDDYNFYILGNKIPQQAKQKIEKLKSKIRNFSITYFNIENDDFKNCPITGYVNYITKATYYRFKIPELLWNIDRVLYLDSDTIVTTDISELYNVDMEENYIAAVPEAYNQHHKKRLEIDGDNYYCNAGVILMNLNKIRRDGIDKLLFEYAEHPTRKIIYQDQDILNEVLKYKIKYLPLAWNLQHDAIFYTDSYPYHKKEKYNAVSAPKLIHFTNKYKPWHYKCQNPYKKQYLKYLKKTCFRTLFFKLFLFKTVSHIIRQLYQKKNENYTKTIKILGIKFKRTDRLQDIINRLSGLDVIANNLHLGISNAISELNDKFSDINKEIVKTNDEIESIATKINHNLSELKNEIKAITPKYNIDTYSISSRHLEIFSKYRNINNGKDVVLIATAPSVKKFQPIENAVYVGVNRAFQVENINYDYMFCRIIRVLQKLT